MQVADRLLSADEAAVVLSWRYPAPYDVYDVTSTADLQPVLDDGALVGFACFGTEARVVGQRPVDGVVDVGAGLAPHLLGAGLGSRLWPALRTHAVHRWQPECLRAAVAAFNERSTRLCLSAGFVVVREFAGPGGRPFRELLRTPA